MQAPKTYTYIEKSYIFLLTLSLYALSEAYQDAKAIDKYKLKGKQWAGSSPKRSHGTS